MPHRVFDEIFPHCSKKNCDKCFNITYNKTPYTYDLKFFKKHDLNKFIKKWDINAPDKYDWLLLSFAITNELVSIVEFLLKNNACPHIVYHEYHDTAIHRAIEIKNYKITKLLIQYGVDVNLYAYWGRRPLMMATERNLYKIAKILLKNGADPNLDCDDHGVVLLTAVKNNNLKFVKLFLKYKVNVLLEPTHNSSHSTNYNILHFIDNYKITKLLLKNGADVNKPNWLGATPIIYSIRNNNLKIAILYLLYNFDFKYHRTLKINKWFFNNDMNKQIYFMDKFIYFFLKDIKSFIYLKHINTNYYDLYLNKFIFNYY